MKCGLKIAKWVRDKTTKLGQYTGEINPGIAYRWIQTKEEKNRERDDFLIS